MHKYNALLMKLKNKSHLEIFINSLPFREQNIFLAQQRLLSIISLLSCYIILKLFAKIDYFANLPISNPVTRAYDFENECSPRNTFREPPRKKKIWI